MTHNLAASVAGMPVRVSGGVYDLQDPRIRVAVRGNGELARLRGAFAQARRFPIRGNVTYALLAEGPARNPTTWIAVQSPQTSYASTSLQRLHGLLAFDGHEMDIVDFHSQYGGVALSARGRVAMAKQPNAIDS